MTSGFHVTAARGHKQFEFGSRVWYREDPKKRDGALPGKVIGIELTEGGHGSVHVELEYGPEETIWVTNAAHLENRWETPSAPKVQGLR